MTQRAIPAALLAHLQQSATTTTRLLKIMLRNGSSFGLCMLDRDVEYDDGAGSVTYVSTNGFDPSQLSADLGFSVANAEGYALISDEIEGIEIEMIEAGELDDAQWIMYLVNFNDLSMGHLILDAGDVGEVRTQYGLVWIPELLSYIMRLKQTVGSVWSRKCRAIFGSPANSQTGCGVQLGPLWVSGEVLAVDTEENDRIFTGDQVVITSPGITPAPGRVQFLTGDNAGREFPVEEVDGEIVSLFETTPHPIQIGDTYRIRPDCMKRYLEDCIQTWANGPNFKGEPYIPVGDASALQSPGAQLGGGGGHKGKGAVQEV